jgi:hypothetical protein
MIDRVAKPTRIGRSLADFERALAPQAALAAAARA